jgi:signal transduction histidine kinase
MTLFLSGVAAFVGVHHLWFWLERRQERVHLWMTALSVGTLTYLPGYHLQMSSPDPELAILGARLQWTGGTVLIVVLLGLVNRFVGRRAAGDPIFRTAAVLGAAYVFCVWFTETVVGREAILRVTVDGARYWGVARGPVMFAFVPFMLAVGVACIVVLARAREMERFERRLLLSAIAFYLLVGVNEVLFALRLIPTVRLFAPAFALLGVAFSILLARRFDALARDNERLLVEVRAQAGTLAERNAELDAFAYTVSHDLKAPLVAIEGMADLLREHDDGRLDPSVAHGLGRIHANAQRMKRLIADVLRFSRVGREGHEPGPVDLHEVLDAVLDEFAAVIRQRQITVTRPRPVTVWGTRTHLEQVFRNLLDNAVKFSVDDSATVIEISTIERGAMVECAVRDNGIGIDPAHHARLFDVFHRIEEGDVEGTGVGLALVKKIVELNGGRVWVESAKGRGATFRFTWPLAAG